jgi:N-methylhydantoinase A
MIIAIDTGGTFTDVVCWSGGPVRVVKVPSTPDDPARAVLSGIAAVLEGGTVPFTLVHGSTVATNALLERKGARVGLVTNAGFEDVLEIGRQNRPQLYALVGHRPPPLVARADRHGVAGRLGPAGEELEPLDEAELAALAERLRGVASAAVCLLHSYADGGHERRIADALAALGVPVSVSSELVPEYREYERTATTVVNAYVAPLMDRYLGRIEAEAGARRVRIMGSGGGAVPVARARRDAAHTVLSGPAGGVAGALAVARRAGVDRILTFDMGGTSTDVSLCPGRPLHTRDFSVSGVPVALSVLDIHTVGAGGGSIARVDAGGALRVGPESAGALPGPICYGRGGTAVTVTDAHVWLGRLPVGAWRHGALDREAVARPLEALARAAGSAAMTAAAGVVAVANAAMEGALRVISVERGHDPADFTLVSFGGAAGLHAVELAARLGVAAVLVPPDAGVLSAYGMLVAPLRKEASRTVLLRGRSAQEVPLEDAFAALEQKALAAMAEEDVAAADVALSRLVDARYRGQSYELTVPAADWVGAFHAAHERRYGYARPGELVEAVTLRVEAIAEPPAVPAPRLPEADAPPEVVGEQTVHGADGASAAVVHDRAALRPGHRIIGPAVLIEYSATTWIPDGWAADVLADGALRIVAAKRSARS